MQYKLPSHTNICILARKVPELLYFVVMICWVLHCAIVFSGAYTALLYIVASIGGNSYHDSGDIYSD